MGTEVQKEIELEIAHVLFLDIVGYSKLSVNEQHARIEELNEVVRLSEQFRKAEAANRILKIPAGDGMALVFYKSPEEPAQCAIETSRTLKNKPRLQVRMGIHSGPVTGMVDVNERTNVAGGGINMARRVMDCGDAGHILLSHHVAEDLEPFDRWRPFLHDIGTFEVKHGARVSITNLYSDKFGNPKLPGKLQAVRKHRARLRRAEVAITLVVLAAVIAGAFFFLRRPTHSTSAVLDKSIAVLPFENLSSDKENAYFADGVQDEILTHLAKIADLKVISQTSVMQYKSGAARNLRKIGEELGVAHVLEGSVQRAANKIRVNAQLVDARTDAHLWAQTYDRDLADVFAVQSEIAQAIADQLQAKLSPNEKKTIEERPTGDIAAFDLYSRGKTLILTPGAGVGEESSLREGIELLRSATALDPTFHTAFCQLVFGNDLLYVDGYDHSPERLSAAESALRAAERLRPDSPETHLARASHLYFALRDYEGAQMQLDVAAHGLPNDSRILALKGYIVRRKGKAEEGLRLLRQAMTLDPRNASLLEQIAVNHMWLRQYAEATEAYDRLLQIKPDDLLFRVVRTLGDWYAHADPAAMCQVVEQVRLNTPESVSDVADNWFLCALSNRDWAAAEQALAAVGDNPCWVDMGLNFSRRFGEGLLARAMHDETRARREFAAARTEQEQLVQKQKDYGPPLCVLGLIDAALGNKEAALQEGRRAMELLPRETDATNSETLFAYFAVIAAWAGEKDLALQQLNEAILLYGAGKITSYGVLKLMPFWDPLRGDPRFEKIVASLAPKDVAPPAK
jgi:TolB-like protein/class 3 adenylate cyclase/Flp pilus assembly protein TadD